VTRLLRDWRDYLLTAFSGSPDGTPPWIERLAQGDDEGYFGPRSAVWEVHGGTPVIVAGIRALLMQTLHPGAMAGVHDWSRYREDPLGRLAGTVQWVLTTTFADRAGADAGSAMVRKLHTRVAGTYGDGVAYSAADPELLRWVHVVFAEAFLTCHQTWGGQIPGGPDQYVAEWATAGDLMEVVDPPRTEAELRQQLANFGPVLQSDDRVAEAVRFIRNPPLKRSLMPAYRIIFGGAVSTIEPQYQRMLGLRRPWWPARLLTAIALRALALLLGRPATAQLYSQKRIDRLLSEQVT
jgi:uncharacterized protein (DUF2236 family)